MKYFNYICWLFILCYLFLLFLFIWVKINFVSHLFQFKNNKFLIFHIRSQLIWLLIVSHFLALFNRINILIGYFFFFYRIQIFHLLKIFVFVFIYMIFAFQIYSLTNFLLIKFILPNLNTVLRFRTSKLFYARNNSILL